MCPVGCRWVGLLTLLAVLLSGNSSSAQAPTNYYWNAPNGGTGTWVSDGPANWSTSLGGPTDYSWSNSGFEIANFGDTAGTVTVGLGGVLAYGINFTTTGYTITSETVTLTGTGGIIDTGSVNATINSAVAGSVGLTKSGTGTLVLGSANTYSGTTTVNAGVLSITNGSALGTTGAGNTTTVASGAALQVSGGLTVSEAITLNGSGISNGGALRNVSGTNTWSGAITLGSASRINSDAETLTITGVIGGSGQSATFGGAGNITLSGTNVIGTGSGSITKDGAGVLTISNSNSWTGALTINGGVVSISATGNLGTTGLVTLDGGTLRETNPGSGGSFISSTRGILVGPNGGTVDYSTGSSANSSIYAGTITGTGTLTKVGNGEFRYQGTGLPSTTFTKLVVNEGLYRLGFASATQDERGFGAVPSTPTADAITLNGGAIGASFAVTLHSNRGITLGASGGSFNTSAGSMTVPSVISGTGALNKNTTGTLTLSGANSYTGTTNISAGTIAAGAANSFSAASPVVLSNVSGAILNLAGFNQTIASLSGGGTTGGNVTLGSATLTSGGDNTSTTFAGIISGSNGAITKAGAGTLSLTNNNTYTGTTTINNGVLAAASLADGGTASGIGQSSNAATNLVLNGGTLRYTGTGASSDRLFQLGTGAAAGALEVNGASAISFSNTGVVGFVGSGDRTLTLTGSSTAANIFTPTLGDGAGGLTSLIKSGTGYWLILGNNTYTGGTTISGGVLLLGASSTTGSITGDVLNNGTLVFSRSDTVSFPGTISGSGDLVQNGPGTLVLSGNNTYLSGTNITGGTLLANGQTGTNSGTGQGAVTVGGATTLGGTGRVGIAGGNPVQVDLGGTLRPGDAASVGTLTIASGLNMAAGSTLSYRITSPGTSNVAAGSGGSSDSLTSPTNHNYLAVTGSTATVDNGINIVVDGSALAFSLYETYSYKVAQMTDSQVAVLITDPGRFTFVGFSAIDPTLTGDATGGIFLNFTPVPEPTTVLGIGAAGLGLGALVRRRIRRRIPG